MRHALLFKYKVRGAFDFFCGTFFMAASFSRRRQYL